MAGDYDIINRDAHLETLKSRFFSAVSTTSGIFDVEEANGSIPRMQILYRKCMQILYRNPNRNPTLP